MKRPILVDGESSLKDARLITGCPRCVIFDLDGTLVDTIEDLGLACDFVLDKHGIKPKWCIDDYKKFVGNGAKLLVKRAFENKLGESDLESAYNEFKVKYNEIKLDHAHVYPGMDIVVNRLRCAGIKLAVCTNKPDKAAKGMIDALFNKNIFHIVQGALDNRPKKPDPQVPSEILSSLSVSADETVWIGDSNVDMESAHHLGCVGIGVSWGFRPIDNLISAGADIIVNAPEDILKIFEIDIDNV